MDRDTEGFDARYVVVVVVVTLVRLNFAELSDSLSYIKVEKSEGLNCVTM